MRAISLFSGVGGFEIGFNRAGIDTVLQVERDPWCHEVLAHHWPETARIADVRSVGVSVDGGNRNPTACIASWSDAGEGIRSGVDLVYGGFPCTDLSVAGKRAGLGGEHSGLWFEFERVLSELRPRWTVIENVPGLLSSNRGRDFGAILGGLDELGFHVAWAVLDAQHFGVPQRRRRVFLVGGPDRRACEQILAICESCGGHPPARRAAGEDVTDTLGTSADRVSGFQGPRAVPGIVAGGQTARYGKGADSNADDTLVLGQSENQRGELILSDTSHQLTTGGGKPGQGYPSVLVAGTDRASDGHHGYSSPRGDGSDNLVAATMRSHPRPGSNSLGSLTGVRRLTPLECERLMGWPDDWTRWTTDGREIPDTHRYRMCGNGVVATVAEWIGHRLVWVDREAVAS